MGVRILGDDDGACMYDSVTDTAFGPVFADREEAEDYREWATAKAGQDLRRLSDAALGSLLSSWHEKREEDQKVDAQIAAAEEARQPEALLDRWLREGGRER